MRSENFANCAEYVEWLEQNGGERRKRRGYVLRDCDGGETTCSGCHERDRCDDCDVKLCYYLAKCIEGMVLCPGCWCSGGCEKDERL